MSKDEANGSAPEKYEEVVQRLDEVVKRLEGGQLSLEDSLKAFEEGVRLVQRGEKLLGQAERRIEQLLSEDGEEKVAPLLTPKGGEPEKSPSQARRTHSEAEEDDIPF